jgi:hypothetical protein
MQEATINAIIIGYSPMVIIASTITGKIIAIILLVNNVSRRTIIIIILLYAL